MPAAQSLFLPTKGFNTSFKEVFNCAITPPTYNKLFQDVNFMLRKRPGIFCDLTAIGNHVDYAENVGLLMTETAVDVTISPWIPGGAIGASIRTAPSIGTNEFVQVRVPVNQTGAPYTSPYTITAFGNDPAGTGWIYVEDSSIVDFSALAGIKGKRIYFSGTGIQPGAGQYGVIVDATITRVFIEGIEDLPAVGGEFIIYDDEQLTPVIVASGASEWYDGTVFQPLIGSSNTGSVTHTTWKNRYWYSDGKNLFYSRQGQYLYIPETNFIKLNEDDIFKIYPYGDYLLVFTRNKTYGIRDYGKLQDANGVEVDEFILDELFENTTIFSKHSLLFDAKGMYIFTNRKRYGTMSIQNNGQQDSIGVFTDIAPTLRNYFKDILDDDEARIHQTDDSVILYTTLDASKEFVYNYDYQGWLYNHYQKRMNKRMIIANKEYILGDGFIGYLDDNEVTDCGVSYEQRVHHILGVDTIFQEKQTKFYNIILGKYDKIQTGTLELNYHVKNRIQTKTLDLGQCQYIKDQVVSIGTGFPAFSTIADVGVWTTPVNIYSRLTDFIIKDNANGFVYGGMMSSQVAHHPRKNLIHNVTG